MATSNGAGYGIMNLDAFGAAMDKAVKALPQHANNIKRKVALEILAGVVEMSPVDTGRFRGNWQVSLGAPELSEVPQAQAEGMAGEAVMAVGTPAIAAVTPGVDIWISNNVPYAQRLEEGTSKQAPRGVLGPTLGRVAQGLRLLKG